MYSHCYHDYTLSTVECYQLITTAASHSDALDACRANANSHLARVTSLDEKNAVLSLFSQFLRLCTTSICCGVSILGVHLFQTVVTYLWMEPT